MKLSVKIIPIISALCLSAAFVGCEEISEDERYIPVEAVNPVRGVLIEEFTGQSCKNCPGGHRAIAGLRQQYGKSVIPVSIHASGLAYADGELGPDYQGFKIPEGDSYYRENGSNPLPNAIVNRNSGTLNVAQWTAVVESELKKPSTLDIEVVAAPAEQGSRTVDIEVTLKSSSDVKGSLQVWIVESGIVSVQQDGDEFIMDYTHNHILRGVVNGLHGEETAVTANVFKTLDYTYELKEKWVPENVAVVAFFYNGSGVVQAVEAPLSISVD